MRAHLPSLAGLCSSLCSLVFLVGCGKDLTSKKSFAKKSHTSFTLQWGALNLVEVDENAGLLPSSPRLLNADFAVARHSEILPPLLAIQQGTVVGSWGGGEQDLASNSYRPGPYSASFAQCEIGPVLQPLLISLQSLSAPVADQFPKPVSLPAAIAALSSCELKNALMCFSQKLQAASDEGLASTDAVQKGKAMVSILAMSDSFKDCARLSEFDPESDFTFFRMSASDVAFAPSPLYAVSIYEGVQTDYDRALVSLDPVAGIPPDSACGSLLKGCLNSPLPLARCPKCSNLKAGATYTAFLLREARERHQDIRHVVFQMPLFQK